MLRSRSVRLAVAGLAAIALMSGCGRDVPAEAQVGTTTIAPADRTPLPSISGPTLDGSSLDLSSLAGKVVVLNAWASWCVPCQEEVPAFVALEASADPDQVAVVGLDVKDEEAAARAFAADKGVRYPSIVDPSGQLLARIPEVPPAALPVTVVLDRSGGVAARIIGRADAAELDRIVGDLLAEPGRA